MALKYLRLLRGKEELSHFKSCEELGIREGAQLRISLKPGMERCLWSSQMQIKITQPLSGKTFKLQVDEDDTVLDVKAQIRDREGGLSNIEKMRLTWTL